MISVPRVATVESVVARPSAKRSVAIAIAIAILPVAIEPLSRSWAIPVASVAVAGKPLIRLSSVWLPVWGTVELIVSFVLVALVGVMAFQAT